MFFKDFDGSIIEVPQKKVVVRKRDLKRLARQNDKNDVNVYGDQQRDLTTLIMNTHLVLEQGQNVALFNEPEGAQEGEDSFRPLLGAGPKIKGRRHGVGDKAIGILEDVHELRGN